MRNFQSVYAARLIDDAEDLAEQWLRRLGEIIDESLRDIFPTELLLDHIPALLRELGRVISAPEESGPASSSLIAHKAEQLGNLRHQQNASVHQLLREYEVLAEILEELIESELAQFDEAVSTNEVLAVSATMERVVRMIMQATVDSFVEKYTAEISRQQEALVSFNNFVSHELKKALTSGIN